MDPLSVTASVIAVVQAAQTVFDGVQKFKDAPKEFIELKTELCELMSISTAVWHCVKAIDGSECREKSGAHHDELLGPDELNRLELTATDLKHAIDEIGKVVESSRDSKGKLNRLIWLRKNAASSRDLRKTARRLQLNLAIHLSSLTPMQIARHNRKAVDEFKKLQQLVTASSVKNELPERRWEPSSGKPLRRWDTQISPSDSLPPYPTKRTQSVLSYKALNNHSDPLPQDAKVNPNQFANRFPKVPLDEPSSDEGQPGQISTAEAIAIAEPCATGTEKRDPPGEALNEGLPQETKLTIQDSYIDSTQDPTDPQDLCGILYAHAQERQDENAPGSVGGLLEFEILPRPDDAEPSPVASQVSDLEPQDIRKDSYIAAVPERSVTFPQYPLKLARYAHGDFCHDYVAMYDCSCPRSTTLSPPGWVAYLFGAWILVYSMPSLFASLVCCNIRCKSKPKRQIRLHFRLPRWLATNTCLSLFCWDNVHGCGSFLEWRKAREVDAPEVVVAIEKDDVRWLQRQVATRGLRPFDILKGVGDPLAYSLTNIESGCGIEVASFLFRSGFHSLSTSYQKCNASYTAKLKLKIGIDYEQRHVSSILQDIADLDRNPNLDRTTIIHDAALRQTSKTLREILVQDKKSVNDCDGLGFTALHWSVVREDVQHVKTLLKAGADVTKPTVVQLWSALHMACMRSDSEITRILIEAGAQLDQEDHLGRTPLHYVPIRDADLVNLLLIHGADAKHEDYLGNSILHNMACTKPRHFPWARRHEAPRNGLGTIRMFLSRGVGMDVANTRGETPTMLLTMHNSTVFGEPFFPCMVSFKERFPDRGWNVLHYAAYYWDTKAFFAMSWGDYEFASDDWYEWPGFDPDARDKDGKTPLDVMEHRMFAADEDRMAGVYRPTREVVERLVSLLRACREENWNQGRYLDTKQRFLEDGSLDRMDAWLAIERNRWVCLTEPELREYDETIWQATDPWVRDCKEVDSV